MVMKCMVWWTTNGGWVARLVGVVVVLVCMANVVGFGVSGYNDAMRLIRGNKAVHTTNHDNIAVSLSVLQRH